MARSVAVIIPTWNRAASLARAIESCLAQTVGVAEILVCDDGSTDATKTVVAGFADPRIKWCPGGHGGRPAIPRNRGIRACRSDWLAFLDDDDEWLPHKLERQFALADKRQCLAACSNAYRVLPAQQLSEPLLDWRSERLTFEDILAVNRVICSSALIHRSLVTEGGGFPESPELVVGEDYALWLKVAARTDFAFVPEPLLYYRDDPATSIRSRGPDARAEKMNVLRDFFAWAAKRKMSDKNHKIAVKHYRSVVVGGLKERLLGWRPWLKIPGQLGPDR